LCESVHAGTTTNATQASNKVDAAGGAGASGFEFLSDQLSNWLGQVSTSVNIILNYKPKDIYSREETESCCLNRR